MSPSALLLHVADVLSSILGLGLGLRVRVNTAAGRRYAVVHSRVRVRVRVRVNTAATQPPHARTCTYLFLTVHREPHN